MSPVYLITISMILLLVGINLTANNTLHSFIVHYLFYNDTISKKIIRLLGFLVLISVLLLILNLVLYAIIINIFVGLIFAFLTIKGRSKIATEKKQKRILAKKAYEDDIERKRVELEAIRQKKRAELAAPKKKSSTVNEIKENLWDDGSKTNKELIEGLNEDLNNDTD